MGRLRTAPKLNSVSPYWFEHAFVQEQLICERELRFASQKPVQALNQQHSCTSEPDSSARRHFLNSCVYLRRAPNAAQPSAEDMHVCGGQNKSVRIERRFDAITGANDRVTENVNK